MSSTSQHGSHIAYSTSYVGNSGEPVSAYLGQMLSNNIAHVADSAGRVLVNWAAVRNANPYLQPENTSAEDSWKFVARFGPVPLLLKPNGLPYGLRVFAAARSTAATEVQVRVVIGARVLEEIYANEGGTNTITTTFTSTTAAWKSQTDVSYMATLDQEMTDAARVRYPARVDVAGSRVAGVDLVLPTISVWALTTNAGDVADVLGLYVAEFYDG